ncbi:MAG: 1-deoxy-D-xylulose-5-phosphate reductoisomerase [Clostridia bacterium]|nr:1-deoxy-D-xylulose-5-phosphate reductoisomerase [Clostridia bacterium]
MPKGIVILGSTGSIGRQTLAVIDKFPDKFQVLGLAASKSNALLAEQIRRYRPRMAALLEPEKARLLEKEVAGLPVKILAGPERLVELVQQPEVELVVAAMAGIASLQAVLEAVGQGKTIALANKEVLVAAGEIIQARVQSSKAKIIPVDSEHSAIFQCLRPGEKVKKIILPASGGPFLDWDMDKMARVTPAQALKHPNWKMGAKITVDSATLMNKGLEVIEARHLFALSYDQIEVLIHRQSIVHGMVIYNDGSLFAYLAQPDMRLPIQYALSWPERWENAFSELDLAQIGELEFNRPDTEKFPCLELAYQAGRAGGTFPAVLSAADEIAVQAFLSEKIPFLAIPQLIADVMAEHDSLPAPGLEEILAADAWARRAAEAWVEKRRSSF